ncbi:putative Chondroitin AC eliminase [Vibrio nigripulchritudo MADA3029]|uniref:polysaccharide lyase family 8 super-sandwich domain-containing protein n=1 Tax=Vibrio nigripulchritudo TaxID=28173 RepID=UPI0003B21864|nr:polysaccharide lyase family 8 super-sandwich domain-containing protein [Vibrio nigripulchritudo]CCN45591.1 putative Chondroitin AC eliminase [Vibrio nigripulchritudo MADA3020]CCN55844.1 putative Chondroitin AC eliminase [Vibrio nigripulchritudo MADA3021]CCN57068.1 putative Chondroitin AC eliminase [Vibrio nigripulchritudo MADA3029]
MINTLASKYIKTALIAPVLLASQLAFADDISTLKQRIAPNYANQEASSAQSKGQSLADLVNQHIASQNADGSWPDIAYDKMATEEKPIRDHLDRLKVLAAGVKLNLNPGAYDAVVNGLNHWYSINPVNKNWWWNDIGRQLRLGPIAMMLGDRLPSSLVTQIAGDMPSSPSKTGANRTDLSKGVIWGGLLNKDTAQIGRGLDGIEETIVITSDEGIQSDFSFQQHGPQLYTRGYGEVFFKAASFWAYQVRDLSWKFSPQSVDVLTDYFLEGVRWSNSKGTLDYNASGRGISRKMTLNPAILTSQSDYIAGLSPQRASEANAFKQHVNGGPSGLNGFKSFWRSDYATKVGPEHFIGIKMNSARIEPTEAGNGENLLGYWLGFGSTMIMQTGDEYHNLFPVWDWTLVPGVTAPHIALKPADWGQIEQQTTFVGGVSNGKYGVAVMDMNVKSTQAKKAWFSFNDELVALGAGISSTHEKYVSTTINQTRLRGPVTVDGNVYPKGSRELVEAGWVHHDNIGYVFPDRWYGHMDNETKSGNWHTINTGQENKVITDDVFMLRMGHSWQPTNATYQYIIAPNKTASQTQQYAANLPVTVLSNTDKLQAVRHAGLGITGIVFHQAGTIDLTSGATVTVNKPSVVLVDESASTEQITLSTPGVGTGVEITYNKGGQSKNTTVYTFGNPNQLGKGVTVDFNAPVVVRPVTVPVLADAFVRDGMYQDKSYGNNSYLVVKKDGLNYSRKTALKFDLTAQDVTASTRAVLRLNIKSVNTDSSRTITVSKLNNGNWQENGVTWATLPAVSTFGAGITIQPSDAGKWVEVDVSDLIHKGVVSLVLENRGTASGKSDVGFSSKESGQGAQLVLTP